MNPARILQTVVTIWLCTAFPLQAAEPKKVVLQLTDGTPQKHALVLNVATNLMNSYGKDTKVEIVAFGPGLPLMLVSSPETGRVKALAERGVRFSACRNTMKKLKKVSGKEPPLTKYAVEVQGGAQRIIELVEQGYILIRP